MSDFRETELIFYNSNIVLTKLSSPSVLNSNSKLESLDITKILKKIYEITEFVKIIQRNIKFDNSETEIFVYKFIKNTMTYVQSETQIETNLEHTQLVETVRVTCTKVTRRTVQKGGVITVEKVKKQIRLRTQREQES